VTEIGDWFGSTALSGSLLLAIPVAVVAGLVSFFSPCVMPLLPGYVSYVSGLSAVDLEHARRGRMLAGTALFVLGFTAVFGVVAFTALGHVDWDGAALVGLPAMAGTILGTWAQQRISSRLLVVLFALFIIAVAIELFIS